MNPRISGAFAPRYDDFGNTRSISVDDNLLVSYLYAPNNSKLQSMTYANGTTVRYYYDTLDRISKICYTVDDDPVQEYVYTYTVDGALKSVESTMGGRGYEYTYDSKGQMIGYTEYDTGNQSSLLQATYLYNTKQQLDTAEIAFSYTAGGTAQSDMVYSYYEYRPYVGGISADGGDILSKMHLDGAGSDTEVEITYAHDALYRMTEKVRTWNETLTMRESYDFADGDGSVYASTRIDEFTSTVGATSSSYSYTYDLFGNIQTITDSAGKVTKYHYDDQQQLVREDNPYTNKTYVYTYDRGGNRTSKTTYTYTTGSLSSMTGTTTNYTYSGDRLTAIGSTAITYDALGNPLTYGTAAYTWQNGRQLARAQSSIVDVTYSYNADGIRTSKTVTNTISNTNILHTYDLSGSSIVRECIYDTNSSYVETELRYYYDAKGAPTAMRVFKRTSAAATAQEFVCYFATNLQGDVVALYDEDGNCIASYTYDAWGNNIYKNSTATSNISTADAQWLMNINPFRYRGYYYDTETGLYYLQSRYYNPYWGRFINADRYASTGQGLLGYNMYAYCNNAPVMMTDREGDLPFLVVTAAIGTVAGAIGGAIIASNNGGNVWAGAAIGAAAGALIGTGVGAAAGAALAGSIVASTTAVAAGGSTLLYTVGTGGLAAGAGYLYANLGNALSEATKTIGTVFSPHPTNAGTAFIKGQKPGSVQIGVDPNTLISNGRTILPEKLNACIAKCEATGGIYGYIEVFSNGVIYDGHHRVEYAKMIGAAVDVVIRQGRP